MRMPRLRWWQEPERPSTLPLLLLLLGPLVLGLGLAWLAAGNAEAAAPPPPETWPRDQILKAIRMVESSDRDDVPDGDNGLAIGPYQIHRVYWADANERTPELGGDYQDCRNRAYAERVIDAYMKRHVKEAWAIGHGEVIARTHNGGPEGSRKEATLGYWRKVRAVLGGKR